MNTFKSSLLGFAMLTGLAVIGCKTATEPGAQSVQEQEYDSEAAADITASSLGTESGGAGNTLTDVYMLSKGEQISGIVDSKEGPTGKDVSYDSATGMHSLVVNRSG